MALPTPWVFRLSVADPLTRFWLLAAGAVLVGILVWLLRWRADRSPSRSLPADLGPFPAALYFGDATCVSCIPARSAIDQGALEVRTYEWASHGDVFDLLEIEEVPRLIVVGRQGQILADISGVPSSHQIARAKLQLSRE